MFESALYTVDEAKQRIGDYRVLIDQAEKEIDRLQQCRPLLVVRRCFPPQARTPNDFRYAFAHHRSRGIRRSKALYKAASKLVGVIYSCVRSN